MTIFGLLRIKNEARWIVDVVRAMVPLCARVFVLDDHSTDGTPELCEAFDERVTLLRSPFSGLDETRDKDFLLGQALESVPATHLAGDPASPYWALAIDGDELLDTGGPRAIRMALLHTAKHAFKLRVNYLWNSDMSNYQQQRQIRVDGVYAHFARPSVFRLFNRNFRYQTTPLNGNLHCSSIPQQLLHEAEAEIDLAPLWHLGYNDRVDRLRKYGWYNQIDPGNEGEDYYRHTVQGDIPEVPAGDRLLHAGPLKLVTVEVAPCSAA